MTSEHRGPIRSPGRFLDSCRLRRRDAIDRAGVEFPANDSHTQPGQHDARRLDEPIMTGSRPTRDLRILSTSVAILSAFVLGLLALVYEVIKRHGQALLRLEALESSQETAVDPEGGDPWENLFQHGAPPGSVGMNFELPSLSGETWTLTQLKGRRLFLIFISPSCPHSLSLLPGLAQLPTNPPPDLPLVIIMSHGDREVNRRLMERHRVRLPVLLQDQSEVALQYFVSGTPMAYLLDADGITEQDRIEGPRAILGAAFATTTGEARILGDRVSPIDHRQSPPLTPLRSGDRLPAIRIPRLDGQMLTEERFLGQRLLLILFDPLCAPCVDLLPDLAGINGDSSRPEVIMITRRDPELTRELTLEHTMTYPIAVQDHWEISRQLGVVAVPAACVVGPDGYLESEIAVGQQSVLALLKRSRSGQSEKRLVSLTSLLR